MHTCGSSRECPGGCLAAPYIPQSSMSSRTLPGKQLKQGPAPSRSPPDIPCATSRKLTQTFLFVLFCICVCDTMELFGWISTVFQFSLSVFLFLFSCQHLVSRSCPYYVMAETALVDFAVWMRSGNVCSASVADLSGGSELQTFSPLKLL